MSSPDYDAAVVGAGPAGLAVAVALASVGCRTVVAGAPHIADRGRPDTRTTALLRASVQLLDNTGVWKRCREQAAPLRTIRIIDDTGRLLRAPEVAFDCAEIGGEPFGFNIANTALVAALRARAAEMPGLRLIETAGVTAIEHGKSLGNLVLAEGEEITARLIVGADGRQSTCRKAAGIGTNQWTYGQKALAFNFSHSEPHHGVSNEFHRLAGPFTTVPLNGNQSSLVWVETPAEADRLMALSDDAITAEIEERLHGLLGTVTGVGPRAAFPLSGLSVNRYAARRIALVGEAAHVIPPIGAQGLNLGFRDAAALAECAGAAMERDGDSGSDMAMRSYDKARRGDVMSRTFAVDLLNRSLMTGFLPLQAARGLGLHLLGGVAPLRQLFMREGLAPQRGLPKLMQPPVSPAS